VGEYGSKIMNNFMPQSQTVVLVNRLGMHARAAAKFTQLSEQFNVTTTVEKGDLTASADSIMELMMLTASLGDTIRITTLGPESTAALHALVDLVQKGFEEEVAASDTI